MEDEARAPRSSRFGSLLRQYRAAAGLSQEALAERAKMSVDGVSALERGHRRSPQRQTVTALARALALNPDECNALEAAARNAEVEPVVQRPEESRLPISLSAFIGREAEIDEIAALLRENRLVTIVGSGGIGKTQTALRAAGDLRGSGIFGVRFVSLSSIDASGSVPAAIASALGIAEQPDRSLREALLSYLRNRNIALLLDNCEHVIEAVAATTAELLEGCPRLRVLATSREPLKINGERTYRLPSLQRSEGVALFTDRARGIDHEFALTPENEPLVAEICARLDGIPLAIELAAARINILSLPALAQRLDDRFRVLTVASRTALPRQRTMRAAIDWSYDLLAEPERCVYERLSIFSGGCTLDGAVAVTPSHELRGEEMLDLLSSLIDKSLLTVEFSGTQPRYRLLESFRQHAYEKLVARGEAESLARRHALASIAVAEHFARAYDWHPNDLDPELENARSAIEWAIAEGQTSLGMHLVCGFAWLWRMSRGDAAPKRWFEALMPALDERADPGLAARAWRVLADAQIGAQKIASAQRAIGLAATCGDAEGEVDALTALALGLNDAGRADDALAAQATAMRMCRDHGMLETRRHAGIVALRAIIACRRGSLEEASTAYAEALELRTRHGNVVSTAMLRHNVAEHELVLGNAARAIELARAAATDAKRMRLPRVEALSLANVAACALMLGDVEEASIAARGALELSEGVYPMGAVIAIQHLATVAGLRGETTRAARLRGYVDAWYRARGCDLDTAESLGYGVLMRSLHERLPGAQIEALAREGEALTEEQAAVEALREL